MVEPYLACRHRVPQPSTIRRTPEVVRPLPARCSSARSHGVLGSSVGTELQSTLVLGPSRATLVE